MISIDNFFGRELREELIRRIENISSGKKIYFKGNRYLLVIYHLLDYMDEKKEITGRDFAENVLAGNRSQIEKALSLLVKAEIFRVRDGAASFTGFNQKIPNKVYELTEEGKIFRSNYSECTRRKIEE